MAVSETWRDVPGYGGKYQAIIDRCNGKCKRHILAPDGNYYAWDNTVSINRARKDLRALARQEGRIFAPANWPWPST